MDTQDVREWVSDVDGMSLKGHCWDNAGVESAA